MKIIKRLSFIFAFLLVTGGIFFNASAIESETTMLSTNLSVIPGKESLLRIMAENKDNKAHQYKPATRNVPSDFKVWFMLDGKQVDSLQLKPSEKCIIEFHLSAPVKIQADAAAFTIGLVRDDGDQALIPLSYTVNRDYALEIAGGVKNLEIISGQSVSLDISVTNTGNKELKNLSLKAELPYKWLLDGTTPENLTLQPGQSSLFKLEISVPSSQASGNYSIKITGLNENATSNEVVIPITVKAGMGFAWWMLGLLLAVAIITILYFRKQGRR